MSDVKGSHFGFGAVQACRAASVSAKNGCSLAVPSSAEMSNVDHDAKFSCKPVAGCPKVAAYGGCCESKCSGFRKTFVGDSVNKSAYEREGLGRRDFLQRLVIEVEACQPGAKPELESPQSCHFAHGQCRVAVGSEQERKLGQQLLRDLAGFG